MKVRRFALMSLTISFLCCALWWGLVNPFNAFVPRSERFSLDRFQTISVGSSIMDAIKVLGKPIKVVKEDRSDPSCPTCVSYCFMGEPPSWVVSFQEAWLVADQKGKIVRVFVHREP
jgi:hypothetical protein